MTFMDFFEEASKIPGIDFRTLSIMNLMNQYKTNSTNSIMAPDDNESIRVWFKEDSVNYTVDETFQKLFIKQAKDYNILREYPNCGKMKIKIFFMNKGKYYDLSPIVRRFVFDTDYINADQGKVHTTYTNRAITQNMSFLIEKITSLTNPDMKSLSLANLVNQNLTRSTNLRMSSDENEYIEVFFQKNIENDFKKKFIELGRRYNIFIHWSSCPLVNLLTAHPDCKTYYLPSQYKELKRHMATHIIGREKVNLLPPTQIFWMKKGKYYDLSLII